MELRRQRPRIDPSYFEACGGIEGLIKDTELKAMAAPTIIGLSNQPALGGFAPAAEFVGDGLAGEAQESLPQQRIEIRNLAEPLAGPGRALISAPNLD